MKKRILLASILTAGLSLSTDTLVSAQTAKFDYVKNAQQILKDFEASHGKKDSQYFSYVFGVAEAYLYAGKREEAEATFKQCLSMLDNRSDADTQKGLLKIRYANALINARQPGDVTAQDRERALSLMKEMEEGYDKNNANIASYVSIASVYYRGKEKKALNELEAKMTSKIQKETQKPNLTRAEIQALINNLIFLSRLHATRTDLRNEKAISESEFEIADKHLSQALSLCEKLPEKDPYKLQIYRDSITFYRTNGKNDQSLKYTKILANDLGTNDPDVLFPKRIPCHACGMG